MTRRAVAPAVETARPCQAGKPAWQGPDSHNGREKMPTTAGSTPRSIT
ncbi:hypothetical protein OEIGOIKO_02630 [Streptomyces chrestomyceticus JCM 4735]|uniref:Uncharacterized protein n=1 Tax=Streptomyces chrestomyceticus JCM 4735 TaxID=1306181 RepID=A0A7U9KT31_9ACTN|nr:hypothetical protein [Streptomyces chrestomyceticus]GCD34890.1 hypothetical protein OEIGOIKO_02630 [Streptomyces chrestomyceticus JCM 4735]